VIGGPAARTVVAATALAVAVTAAGCSREAPHTGKPIVAVSVVPQAFPVRRIAGDLVEIEVMIPPGANEATHEPTIGQLQALSRASIYVKVGHPAFAYERTWLDKLIAENRDLIVVDSSDGVQTDSEDPHLWVSPENMRSIARGVYEALVRVLPEHEAEMHAALDRLEADVDNVDAYLERTLAPARGRRFFVFHPAWGYLAKEYGLVQVAIEEHGKEPDASALARTIDVARAANVRVIFVQPQFNEASARLVAEEVGARLEAIDPLAPAWDDNLREVGRKLAEYSVP